MNWRQGPAERVQDEGDIGGDGQLTTAWGLRYIGDPITEEGQELHPVLNVAFYGEDENAPDEYTGRVVVVERSEMILCANPDDPGDTGEWDAIRYVYFNPGRPLTAAEAEPMCRRLADEHTSGDIEWDGSRDWERGKPGETP